MAGGTETVRSLIQGVSQQDDFSRGDASAESQENCLNEVIDGVVSRMGTIVLGAVDQNYNDPFIYEINRSSGERYLVMIEGTSLRVWNRVTGLEATVTGSITSYLSHTGPARDAFEARSVGDTTFLLNRQKVVEMATTLSPARPNKAIAHFKAGGYKVTYELTIRISGVDYSISFTTPDNSTAANAEFITTDYLAEQFRLAFVATMIPALNAASKTGFTITRIGSTLIIFGAGHTFDIRTTDGVGDKQFVSFKDNVKTLTDLPGKCQDLYQVSVSGDGSQESSKYFLQYQGESQTGRWVEVVAPATPIELKASTMPQLLINTAADTFTVGVADWGDRLAGDGDLTAQDPSFIGETIKSIQFLSGRLSMVGEFTSVLSRARNGFVFFPDTVQTNLDTAPIDYDITNGSPAPVTHSVLAGGKLQFWGDGQQTYLDSGQDPIREDTTEILPLTNYAFDGRTGPKPMGMASLVFGTQVGYWAKVVEVYYRGGKPDGEIEITAHVPRMIEGSIRHVAPGEAAKKIFVLTDDADDKAFLYQWYNQGNERVQSAWNTWKFTGPSKVLWAGIEGNKGYFLFRWPTGCSIEYVHLDSIGDEPDQTFPMRLDHRMSSTDASSTPDGTELILAYSVAPGKRSRFKMFERVDNLGVSRRGQEVPFEWLANNHIRTQVETPWYFGAIPTARRKNSKFYAKDRQGNPVVHDKLLIKKLTVSHKNAVSYYAEVTSWGQVQSRQRFDARQLGDPDVTNVAVPVKDGTFKVDVGEDTDNITIELINDTVFPCIWAAQKVQYDLTERDAR